MAHGQREKLQAEKLPSAPILETFAASPRYPHLTEFAHPAACSQEVAANVEFVVPNAQVTSTKTFRQGNRQPEPYAVSIGSTRVRRVSPFAVHAEYQVRIGSACCFIFSRVGGQNVRTVRRRQSRPLIPRLESSNVQLGVENVTHRLCLGILFHRDVSGVGVPSALRTAFLSVLKAHFSVTLP